MILSEIIKNIKVKAVVGPTDVVRIYGEVDHGLFNTEIDIDYIEKMNLSPVAQKILRAYNEELVHSGAVDFGDIILYVLKLFENNIDILHKYQNQFKYIMVDEFQDTNAAQMNLLKMLTRDTENPNICCVGDDDQSIYSWRGAEIKNILDFEKTYPGAKIIHLEINYRSFRDTILSDSIKSDVYIVKDGLIVMSNVGGSSLTTTYPKFDQRTKYDYKDEFNLYGGTYSLYVKSRDRRLFDNNRRTGRCDIISCYSGCFRL